MKKHPKIEININRDRYHAYNIFFGEFMKVHAAKGFSSYKSRAEQIQKTRHLNK